MQFRRSIRTVLGLKATLLIFKRRINNKMQLRWLFSKIFKKEKVLNLNSRSQFRKLRKMMKIMKNLRKLRILRIRIHASLQMKLMNAMIIPMMTMVVMTMIKNMMIQLRIVLASLMTRSIRNNHTNSKKTQILHVI